MSNQQTSKPTTEETEATPEAWENVTQAEILAIWKVATFIMDEDVAMFAMDLDTGRKVRDQLDVLISLGAAVRVKFDQTLKSQSFTSIRPDLASELQTFRGSSKRAAKTPDIEIPDAVKAQWDKLTGSK